MKPFTHFVDREDGGGNCRDYNTKADALRAHSRAVKDSKTTGSRVREYADDGHFVQEWANWSRGA